jgi:hypothetical protein
MKETNNFLQLRIYALETELKRVNKLLNEISQASTEMARDITVLINDEVFNQPIKK